LAAEASIRAGSIRQVVIGLLQSLRRLEEVGVVEAERQRRLHLHVAYGNALFAARGPGAPKTTEAFARARQSAPRDKDALERLAVDYGLWAGSYLRGELSSMRAYAKDFLSDVDAKRDSPEAGIAHRTNGITHHFAGEYAEARERPQRSRRDNRAEAGNRRQPASLFILLRPTDELSIEGCDSSIEFDPLRASVFDKQNHTWAQTCSLLLVHQNA
jgi:hypothetical protein